MAESATPETDQTEPQPQAPPSVQPRTDVDPVLNAQLLELQNQAKQESEARVKGTQTKWMIPQKKAWSGDTFDYPGMAKPFDRSKSNQDFVDAISDPTSPGTNGDLTIATMQVDYLAVMERSFRARHCFGGRARVASQMSGRKMAHGNDKGPIVQCVLESIRGLVKENKDTAATGDPGQQGTG